jgi:predicted nucleic acid-binding protein
MIIIIDSNNIFALKSKKDKKHQRSLELMNELKEKYSFHIIRKVKFNFFKKLTLFK